MSQGKNVDIFFEQESGESQKASKVPETVTCRLGMPKMPLFLENLYRKEVINDEGAL